MRTGDARPLGVIMSSRALGIWLTISDGVRILCVGKPALADEAAAGASLEACFSHWVWEASYFVVFKVESSDVRYPMPLVLRIAKSQKGLLVRRTFLGFFLAVVLASLGFVLPGNLNWY